MRSILSISSDTIKACFGFPLPRGIKAALIKTAELIRATVAMIYLGARYSDLWPGVDVDSTVSLPRDGAAHCVSDPHSQSPPLLTVVQGHEAVSGLPCRVSRNGKHNPFMERNNSHNKTDLLTFAP